MAAPQPTSNPKNQQNTKNNAYDNPQVDDEYSSSSHHQLLEKTNMQQSRITFLVLGELGNDPAERTVTAVDPMNLNQVILAEGKKQFEHH